MFIDLVSAILINRFSSTFRLFLDSDVCKKHLFYESKREYPTQLRIGKFQKVNFEMLFMSSMECDDEKRQKRMFIHVILVLISLVSRRDYLHFFSRRHMHNTL